MESNCLIVDVEEGNQSSQRKRGGPFSGWVNPCESRELLPLKGKGPATEGSAETGGGGMLLESPPRLALSPYTNREVRK